MNNPGSIFDEACRVVGRCCMAFAQYDEEISLTRLIFWLEHIQMDNIELNGEPDCALALALERLKAS